MCAVSDVIDEESSWSVVIRDHDIDIAVVVHVAKRRAASNLGHSKNHSGSVGDVLETAIAKISQQKSSLVQGKRIVGLSESLYDLHRAVDRQEVEPTVV